MVFQQEKLLWMLSLVLYQGPTLSRAAHGLKENWASAPAMAYPARNACPATILSSAWVFFATTKTSMTRRLLQSERNAMLLIDVLRSNVGAGKFQLHDFVICQIIYIC